MAHPIRRHLHGLPRAPRFLCFALIEVLAATHCSDDVSRRTPCDGGSRGQAVTGCPSGTDWRPPNNDYTCEPGTGKCVTVSPIDPVEGSARALVDGFGVESVELRARREADDPFVRFTWSPPSGVRIASCALFGCTPIVADGAITNYAQCVLRSYTAQPPGPIVDTVDFQVNRGKREPARLLALGCWLYDQSSLIAATPLEPVSTSEIPNAGQIVQLTCPSGSNLDDMQSCPLPSPLAGLGVCVDCKCTARCLSDSDCQVIADRGRATGESLDDAGADAGVHCTFVPKNEVGYCQVPNSSDAGACR
jgi:hypothetical protein